MRLSGLGDAQCSGNPCGWADFLSPTQPCIDFVKCAAAETASDSFSSTLTGGVPLTTVAYGGGVVASDAAGYVAKQVSDAVAAGVAGGTGLDPGSTGNSLLSIGLIAGAALIGLMILTRR